ncbi:MAG: branched-chain amino acid ABC transporter permease [Alphaproteobacteria bacterium]|nr:branched-chain amino acid ABC transporter permease [Alphaproteobacteria bacterium]
MQLITTMLLDGLSYASYLFIVSVGLTIIFGVMKILNVAHGAFYAWGAYAAAYAIGLAADNDWPDWSGFVLIFVAAILVGIVLGTIIERLILRKMYHEEEVLIVLATFGIFLILEDVILLVFGVNPYFAYQPMALLGSVKMGGIIRDVYSLTLFGLAILVAFGCWYGLNRTKWGKLLSVVIFDREISLAMGINVQMVYLVTFILGATLGALGGAYIAPTISVAPGFGIDVIVLSFAVVVIGGMGSIPGALIGSLMVGILRAIAVHKFPEFELFVVFGVMAAVLMIRPEGLFAPEKARRI